MSIKKRIENIEKQTKDTGADNYDSSDPKERYIWGICQRYGIPFKSRIVGIWRRFLIKTEA